ncbi:MAG: phage tail protein [Firmicutes bacterium]|nr:phage tail protein [Bacillota bacterium]
MSLYDSLARADGHVKSNKIDGVVVGIVTNNKDPEKMGRVKLKLPIRECQNETNWARVATLMAGSSKGTFFLPEVGDEVLVAFGDGDMRKPYVIGMLWNSKEKPPETNSDGKNNIRKIKSRSGHELVFDDDKSSGNIVIHTNKGHTITLDDSGSGKIEIKDKSKKNTVTVNSATNEIKLQSGMKISLKSKSCSLLIDSMKNSVTLNSGLQLKLKAQKVDIEAGGMMNIKSGGLLNLKGTMVKIN